ncbi:MAG: hypothetical protein JW703_03430 [Candidatus Diapherotrites archaeon]|nr:hypothetical protein [Candidatus Diapherotrites archaeon]
MQAKKDFILQLICNGTDSVEEIKKETNYSYSDVMLVLKHLINEKKIVRENKYPLKFNAMKKISKELKEMNSLMIGTCCMKH